MTPEQPQDHHGEIPWEDMERPYERGRLVPRHGPAAGSDGEQIWVYGSGRDVLRGSSLSQLVYRTHLVLHTDYAAHAIPKGTQRCAGCGYVVVLPCAVCARRRR
jgi:hypothetical protein